MSSYHSQSMRVYGQPDNKTKKIHSLDSDDDDVTVIDYDTKDNAYHLSSSSSSSSSLTSAPATLNYNGTDFPVDSLPKWPNRGAGANFVAVSERLTTSHARTHETCIILSALIF